VKKFNLDPSCPPIRIHQRHQKRVTGNMCTVLDWHLTTIPPHCHLAGRQHTLYGVEATID